MIKIEQMILMSTVQSEGVSCASFYIFENTSFQEQLVALRIHICIVVKVLFLPQDKGASLSLVGHHSNNEITIKISYAVDVLLC